MSGTPGGERPRMRIAPARRRRLAAVLGANRLSYCYQCGACAGDCGSARFHPGFNPREIMLTALLGALDELLAPGSMLWKCSNCYNCYERCPQDVRPIEVILALKNLAREDGAQPEEARRIQEMIATTGRSAPVVDSVNRRRAALGLPPLGEIDVAEIRALLAPDDEDAADRQARAPADGERGHPERGEGAR